MALAELDSKEAASRFMAGFAADHPDQLLAQQAQTLFLRNTFLEDQAFTALQRKVEQFPHEPRFRIDLLQGAVYSERPDLKDWFQTLEAAAESLGERAALCRDLARGSDDAHLGDLCFRRLWKDYREPDPPQGQEAMFIEFHILQYATQAEQKELAREVLISMRGSLALASWRGSPLFWQSEEEECAAFFEVFLNGDLEETPEQLAMEESFLSETPNWLALLEMFDYCGLETQVERVWTATLPNLSAQEVAALAADYENARQELLHRFNSREENFEVARLVLEQIELFPTLSREKVLRSWAAGSNSAKPWLELVGIFEEENRLEEAETALLAASRFSPDDLDIPLRLAGLALSAGDQTRAEALAKAVSQNRGASERQRLTAGYILGRIALRQGQGDKAAGLLEAYFLRRFEFAGCCQGGLDQGLMAHLQQNLPPERLANYLAAKQQALAEFARSSPFPKPYSGCVHPTCSIHGPETEPVRAKRVLAKGGEASAKLSLLLQEEKEAPMLWGSADPEALFDDHRVLAFDPGFTDNGLKYSSISTSCWAEIGELEDNLFGSPEEDLYQLDCPW